MVNCCREATPKTLLTCGLYNWVADFLPNSFIEEVITFSLGRASFIIASMVILIFSCGSTIGPFSLNGLPFGFE